MRWVTTYPLLVKLKLPGAWTDGHPATKGDVIIGSDVWIGHGATILSGVTIGDGAAIGARAVVSESVPPYAIVSGNPARVIRKRFPDEQIRELLRIKWWDWPIERIVFQIDSLTSPDIDTFLFLADSLDQCFPQ